MKVFYDHKIFSQQERGGPSNYFIQLTNYLNNINVNAKIFAGFHLNKFLKENSIKNNIGFEKKLFFSSYLANTKLVPKLDTLNEIINKNFIKSFKPDIIHTTYYNGSFEKYKKPLVVTVFDLIHEIFYKNYGYQNPQFPKKKALDRADHIICISKSTANDLKKFYNVDNNKISTIYLGTKKNLINNIKSPMDYPYILYVGTRHKYKNFENFLKALSTAPKILNNFKIVLFGGKNLTNFEYSLFKLYKIDPEKFLFYEGDNNLLNSFYQNARLLIYPSKYEGFGLPILEGFANSCPVICSDIPVFKEIADQAVEYFDPNDHLSMANTLSKVLFSDLIRKDLIKRGKKRLKFFSWMKCAEETSQVYKKMKLKN